MGLKKWFENNITLVFFCLSGLLLIIFGLLFPKIMPLLNKPAPVYRAAKVTVGLAGAAPDAWFYRHQSG